MNVDVPVVMAGVGVFGFVALLTCAGWLTARTLPRVLAEVRRQWSLRGHMPLDAHGDGAISCTCGWAPHDATPQYWVNHQEEATR